MNARSETAYLERDHRRAAAAVQLDGVDESTLRSPIEGQLLKSTHNVLCRGLPRGSGEAPVTDGHPDRHFGGRPV